MIRNKEYYLDTFGVSESNLRDLVAEALSGGGDYADLYFENTAYTDLQLKDGAVDSGGYHIDYGCGIRVLAGEKTGYAYAESTDLQQLKEAARVAGAISASSTGSTEICASSSNRYFGRPNPAADRYPMAGEWGDADNAAFIPILRDMEARIREAEPRVDKLLALLSYSTSDVMMFNSFEELKYETRPLGSLSLTVIYKQNGQVQSKNIGRSFRMGSEFLSAALIGEVVAEAADGVDELFCAKRAKGGKMPVVMAAGASGILLHEAMGHAFEADFIRKGQSVFTDRMGQKVCREGINIVDDGTIPSNRGTINYDDEGVPGQKTYMVEDGVLTSFLHDRISARYFGVAPTGNGRRESFRYNPIPRMRATYMESGTDGSAEDIISGVKKGIFVDQFSNGEVKIGEGDFTFYVKSGRLIENGRLTAPIKDINIIGNGPKALSDIVAVGSDLRIDNNTWTCGKDQSVAVSCGIPTVLIKSLTVGGE